MCEPIVVVPNAFSPNNDGLNDVFLPRIENVDEYELLIFNRWGDVIFHTNDPSLGWDGTYKSKPLPSGDYWYVIRLNESADNREFKGNFSLVR